MSFLLKITAGKDAGSEFTLHSGKNMVGRSRSSDVRVFNEDVSGKHFSIEIENGVATLQNISGYGTRVDGVLVHQTIELRSGQVIEAGKSLKFIFEAPETSIPQEIDNNDQELTQATKFIGDIQADNTAVEPDSSEQTSVTKFADDIEQTSVTKFAADVQNESAEETIEQTSVTKFAADIADIKDETEEDIAEQTSVTKFAESVLAEQNDHTSVSSGNKTEIGTVVSDMPESSPDETSNETASETNGFSTVTRVANTEIGDSTKIDNSSSNFFSISSQNNESNTDSSDSDDILEEQGMFFDEEDLDESEKTNANETQIVQTRMASMDEINFIKNQIKKQQQSRLFFKFLIFSLFVVLLGVIWMLKSPPQEKVLSWPQQKNGDNIIYLTKRIAVLDQGFQNGGFDIYYPDWKNSKVVPVNPNIVEIHTFLGKEADVPLIITVQREISDEFVYENRINALQSTLRRLSERKNEQFNFDSSPTSEFLRPDFGESENGLLVDKLAYQRDTGNSFFGILRFFRFEKTNYIVRAEVPAEEKLRALPILNSDTFIAIHPSFIRSHWEGNDEYSKGNIVRTIVGVKDELQRNSPMQYPRLEREIKGILAQSLYEKNKTVYKEAKSLLVLLRTRQQQWYNGQKIRWFSAVRENDTAEKMKVRNDCEAVFSVEGDKRRYDILRDYWE